MKPETRRLILGGMIGAAVVGGIGVFKSVVEKAKCGCSASLEAPGTIMALMRYRDRVFEVPVRDVRGRAVFEGDIVLGLTEKVRVSASRIEGLGGRAKIMRDLRQFRLTADKAEVERMEFRIFGHRDTAKPWPGGVIEYFFDAEDDDLRFIVTKALAHWSEKTGLRFKLINGMPRGARFIRFRWASGNCSWDISQNLASVNAACVRHEVGHALGLLHEHTRSDRSTFIAIQPKNIRKSACEYFKVNPIQSASCGGYDFKSIVHYPSKAFSCNNKATILAKPHNKIEHKDDFISPGDVATVKAIQAEAPCP